MKVLLCFLIVFHASLEACLNQDPQALVTIQNFECPIYVHPQSCDQRRRQQDNYECTCVKQPNYGPGIYNTATYSGVDQKCPDNVYNTGTYLPCYPQTGGDRKFCPNEGRKSCPRTVELDTTLIYGLPQTYQNRQCDFRSSSYY